MKLELKHLAPYLPYELKMEKIKGFEDIRTMGSDINNSSTIVNIGACIRLQYKPILRPLFDFKGMIVRDIKIELELSHNQVMEFFGFMDGEIKLENITLGLQDAMCKKHIDFNKLIEKGLAIDINTIT